MNEKAVGDYQVSITNGTEGDAEYLGFFKKEDETYFAKFKRWLIGLVRNSTID